MTADKYRVLRELAIQHHVEKRNGVASHQLADALDLSQSQVTAQLRKLLEDDLVERINRSTNKGQWRPWNGQRY